MNREGDYYYNKRLSNRSYEKVSVDQSQILILTRYYRDSVSFLLQRVISRLSYHDKPYNNFAGVTYSCKDKIDETFKVKCHGNMNQLGSTTSKEILTKSTELLSSGMNIRDVYDSLNTSSGGPLGSTYQSNEP